MKTVKERVNSITKQIALTISQHNNKTNQVQKKLQGLNAFVIFLFNFATKNVILLSLKSLLNDTIY